MDAMTRSFGVLFAEDFDEPETFEPPEPEVIAPAPEPPPPEEAVFTEAELDAAREAGRAEGRAAGREEARAAQAADGRDALRRLAAAMDEARLEAARVAEEAAEGMARLMLGMLAAALPALCARHGEAEIRAMSRRLLPALESEPRVTIRVNPHHLDAMRGELAGLDPEQAGRTRLLPTDAMPPGDLRIAWDYGQAVRDARALTASMEEALAPLGLLAKLHEEGELAHAG